MKGVLVTAGTGEMALLWHQQSKRHTRRVYSLQLVQLRWRCFGINRARCIHEGALVTAGTGQMALLWHQQSKRHTRRVYSLQLVQVRWRCFGINRARGIHEGCTRYSWYRSDGAALAPTEQEAYTGVYSFVTAGTGQMALLWHQQSKTHTRRVYSLQLVQVRWSCFGINRARGIHEGYSTFHVQCSERRCRTNYHS